MRKENSNQEPSEQKIMEDGDKFAAQVVKKTSLIPPTLLQKPLPPEKISMLNDEEKRLYTIQKNKFESFQR